VCPRECRLRKEVIPRIGPQRVHERSRLRTAIEFRIASQPGGIGRAGSGFCAVSATREHSQRLFTDDDVRPTNSASAWFKVVGAIR
jgi:hypothetical protein